MKVVLRLCRGKLSLPLRILLLGMGAALQTFVAGLLDRDFKSLAAAVHALEPYMPVVLLRYLLLMVSAVNAARHFGFRLWAPNFWAHRRGGRGRACGTHADLGPTDGLPAVRRGLCERQSTVRRTSDTSNQAAALCAPGVPPHEPGNLASPGEVKPRLKSDRAGEEGGGDWMEAYPPAGSLVQERPFAVTSPTADNPCGDPCASIQIFVKTFAGKTITLNVGGADTVFDMKASIQDKAGVHPYLQRFAFQNKHLEDGRLIMDYNIQKDDALRMAGGLAGGTKRKARPGNEAWPLPASPFSAKKECPTSSPTTRPWPSKPPKGQSGASGSSAGSSGTGKVAELEAKILAQQRQIDQLMAPAVHAAMVEPPFVSTPVDSRVELPLADGERSVIQSELDHTLVAIEALKPLTNQAVLRVDLETQADALRRRLHQAKPFHARQQALEAALDSGSPAEGTL